VEVEKTWVARTQSTQGPRVGAVLQGSGECPDGAKGLSDGLTDGARRWATRSLRPCNIFVVISKRRLAQEPAD